MKTILVGMGFCVSLIGACGGHDEVLDGSGVLVVERREVPTFRAVAISQNLHAEIEEGPAGVSVEMDDNLIRHVVVRVDDGILELGPEERGPELRPTDAARIRITVPALDHIDATGAAVASSELAAKSMAVTATGRARVSIRASERVAITAANDAVVRVFGQPPARELAVTEDADVIFAP